VNACTVGIELAGFAGRAFSAAQYASLGALCAGIATRWGFVPDASRVVSHASLQSDRSDPGESFDWEALFAAVQASLPTAATVSDGDREILEVVRGLGADAAGVRGWIEKLGGVRGAAIGAYGRHP
jgi:N-acetyl-anhydromuramyl-L-alanine amidase AmpD